MKKETFDESMNQLKLHYGEDAYKMLYLRTMVLLQPLLLKCNAGYYRPIVIVLPNMETAMTVRDDLSAFYRPEILSLSKSYEKIEAAVKDSEYEMLPFYLSQGKNLVENVEYLSTVNYTQGIQNDFKGKMIFIFSEGIPAEATWKYSSGVVYIQARKSEVTGQAIKEKFFKELIKDISSWGEEGVRQCCEKSYMKGTVIYPFDTIKIILECSLGYSLEQEKRGIDRIKQEWFFNESDEIWSLLIRIGLIEMSGKQLKAIYDKLMVKKGEDETFDEIILFDKESYFLSSKMFDQLCHKIAPGLGLNYIKNQLIRMGFLKGSFSDRIYYTQQITIVTDERGVCRYRCIELVREKIDKAGEISLQEHLRMRLKEVKTNDVRTSSKAGV